MTDDGVRALLSDHGIATLASVGEGGGAQACTVFYVVHGNEGLVFKSRTGSDHARGLARDSSAAMSVYRHDSSYVRKAGVQLLGEVTRITEVEVMRRLVDQYSAAFPGAQERFASVQALLSVTAESTLFLFRIRSYKVTDGWTGRTDAVYQVW